MTALRFETVRALTVDAAEHPRGRSFLSAASGLVRVGERCYVVADDEMHLGVFEPASAAPLRLARLFAGDLPASASERKKRKPDLEALVLLPPLRPGSVGTLLAMGSGSRPNRRRGALLRLDGGGGIASAAEAVDLAPLHDALATRFGAVNVEGAFVDGDELVLLQRGVGGHGNAVARFALAAVMACLTGDAAPALPLGSVRELDLGSADGVAFAFTDGAALDSGDWLFSAVAERTDDSYDDGPCVASLLGVAGRDGTLRALHRLEPVKKVEGIAARVERSGAVAVFMVTDDDNPDVPAELGIARMRL